MKVFLGVETRLAQRNSLDRQGRLARQIELFAALGWPVALLSAVGPRHQLWAGG